MSADWACDVNKLKSELAAMTADRNAQKAGWDNASLTALRLERERNEARECLREAIASAEVGDYAWMLGATLARWRKAAGLEEK